MTSVRRSAAPAPRRTAGAPKYHETQGRAEVIPIHRVLLAIALLALPLAVPAVPAEASTPQGTEDPLLEGATSTEVIIGYRDGGLAAVLDAIHAENATVVRTDDILLLVVARTTAPENLSHALRALPEVEYVEANDATGVAGVQRDGTQWNAVQWDGTQWDGTQRDSSSTEKQKDPGRRFQWGVRAVNAPDAWNVTAGSRSATLCILDSGVMWDHQDLSANAWTAPDGSHGFNAIDPSRSAYDDGGHGTHVAGVAAAVVNNGFGVSGMGNVRVMPVKVLDANGTGREDDLATGLAWCASRGADVALMALTATNPGPTLDRAIRYAHSRDVLLVAAAGNSGGGVTYPGSDPRVVAVSATAKDGRLASFSSRGAAVAMAGPGVEIASTSYDGYFAYGSGTSQAAAFVAGAAALVRDARPDLSSSESRAILEATAKDLGAAGEDDAYGHGLLDLGAAVNRTLAR